MLLLELPMLAPWLIAQASEISSSLGLWIQRAMLGICPYCNVYSGEFGFPDPRLTRMHQTFQNVISLF